MPTGKLQVKIVKGKPYRVLVYRSNDGGVQLVEDVETEEKESEEEEEAVEPTDQAARGGEINSEDSEEVPADGADEHIDTSVPDCGERIVIEQEQEEAQEGSAGVAELTPAERLVRDWQHFDESIKRARRMTAEMHYNPLCVKSSLQEPMQLLEEAWRAADARLPIFHREWT